MHRQGFAKQFVRQTSGSVTILFGLAVTILAFVVGFAIDSARVYDIKARVQGALDAAALASAKLMDKDGLTAIELQNEAENYFQSQLKRLDLPDLTLNQFRAIPDWSTFTVATRVDVRMRSIFGDLAGMTGALDFTPQSTASFHALKIELALVADITGSMCGTPPSLIDPPCTSGEKLDALKAAANDMVDALFETNPSVGAIRVALVPYSASVNAGSYAAAASGGASSDDCVVERSGGDAYTDASPVGNPVGTVAPGTVPYYSCVSSQIRPLTDLASSTQRALFRDAIDNLAGSGGTAGHIGAAWGWYVLSPEWSSVFGTQAGRSWDPARVIKVVVLMTDGQFNISYANGGESAPFPDPVSLDPANPGSSGNQALELCEAMKSEADPTRRIQLYTVAFQAPADAETMLKQCSGADNYYDANNASQLSDAFRDIVRRLNSLRVTS